MRLLTFFAFTAMLFLTTSCQKETIQPSKINSETESLILDGNTKVNDDSITIVNPFTTSGVTGSNPTVSNDVNIVTYLKDNPEFSTFYSALYKTGMVDMVDGDGPFTFFVPDNQAFQTFLSSNNWSTIDDIPVNILTLIVQFHISNTEVKIGELTGSVNVPILFNDKNVFINMDDPEYPFLILGITSAYIVKSDLIQSNGVIHQINGVLAL